MKKVSKSSFIKYKKKNPLKAKIISRAVKRGMKQYAETFRKLAST